MDVLDAIRSMRSVRQFSDEPLPDEAVRSILNAGRRAQSSKNMQPWEFVAVRDRERLRKLSQCGAYAGHLAGATMGVVLVSSTDWAFDIGYTASYMQLAALDAGIGSCLAYIGQPEQARFLLGIPHDRKIEMAISFGYPAGAPQRAAVPRGRRPMDEIVHWEQW